MRCLTSLLLLTLTVPAWAQRGAKEMEVTVKEVREDGRLHVLVVEDSEGTTHELTVTPRVNVEITGPGDESFVKAGNYVKGRGVLTNGQLFVSSVNIFLVPQGKKVPPGKIVKSPRKAGISTNSYDFSGPILARQTSPDYPDYEMLAVQVAGRTPPILLEKNFSVKLGTDNIALAQEGAKATLSVLPARGGKLNLLSASIENSKPLAGEGGASAEGEGGAKPESKE